MTKEQERELDHLCAAVCKALAFYRCERCGKADSLQWHHVFTRRIRALRWLLLNSVCLCSGCHFWWHTVAQGGAQWEWFAEKYGANRLRQLREAQRSGGRPDYDETRRELEAHRGGEK